MNSLITKLSKISSSFYEKHKEQIKDIILFGSILRNKENPEDIDILILFKDSINKDMEYELKKQLPAKVSLISKTEKTIKDSSFTAREAILFEGYSLITKEFTASKSGFESFGSFIYQTSNLTNAEKTRFYHALNGRRGSKGVCDELKAIKLSDNILAVPLSEVEPAKSFLEYWKIEYTYIPLLIPKRLAKKHIIGKVR